MDVMVVDRPSYLKLKCVFDFQCLYQSNISVAESAYSNIFVVYNIARLENGKLKSNGMNSNRNEINSR